MEPFHYVPHEPATNTAMCPACESRVFDFVTIPDHSRQYTNDAGEEVTEHFGKVREFTCDNCDTIFTILQDTRE